VAGAAFELALEEATVRKLMLMAFVVGALTLGVTASPVQAQRYYGRSYARGGYRPYARGYYRGYARGYYRPYARGYYRPYYRGYYRPYYRTYYRPYYYGW
jgi:hypothetical protein